MAKTLTDYLKEVSEESVDIIIDGVTHTVTRTEALARKMFLMAMGGVEEFVEDGEVVTVVHKPNHQVAKSIREFTEGKAAVELQADGKNKTKPGRYSSEVANRLNDRLGTKPARPTRPGVPSGVTQ